MSTVLNASPEPDPASVRDQPVPQLIPMSNMIPQIMALFDRYESKENAKHTLRAMWENARQDFWNGALPPIGYWIVEATEQRGDRTKKTLEIDPVQAETVRLIFRLAREGSGSSGRMGAKSIATYLNAAGIRTRDGGRWGVDAVHKVLTRTTYVGRHRFNTNERAERRKLHIVELRKRATEADANLRRLAPATVSNYFCHLSAIFAIARPAWV